MLALSLALIVVFATFLLAGTLCLDAVRARFVRVGDAAFAACWVGAGVMGVGFLAVALVMPLTASVGLGGALLVSLLALASGATRAQIRRWASLASPRLVVPAAILLLSAALYMSQHVSLYDTGLYHYGAIRWLARYGAVTGLALLHSRFGFGSSWFALSAPFDHGILEGRMVVTLNAFALLLTAGMSTVVCSRCVRGQGRPSDVFFLGATVLVAATAHVFHPIAISASPNYPIILLIIAAAWAMLVSAEGGLVADPTGPHGSPSHPTLVPTLLAAATWGVKVLGGPVLVVSTLHYAAAGLRSQPLRRFITASVLSAILLAPLLAFEWVVSGCLLFPLPGSCVDVPWAFDTQKAAALVEIIQTWPRWLAAAPPPGGTEWNWIGSWLRQGVADKGAALGAISLVGSVLGTALLVWNGILRPRRGWWGVSCAFSAMAFWCTGMAGAVALTTLGTLVIGAAWAGRIRAGVSTGPAGWPFSALLGRSILAGAVTLVAWLLLSRALNVLILAVTVLALASHGRAFPGRRWVLGLGLAGIAFNLYGGPSIWYGLGYVAVTFGTWVAGHTDTLSAFVTSRVAFRPRSLGAHTLAVFLLSLAFVLLLGTAPLERREAWPFLAVRTNGASWLVPPHIRGAAVIEGRAAGFSIVQPSSGDQCWGAQLPCTPENVDGLRLRNPDRGVGGGFVSPE